MAGDLNQCNFIGRLGRDPESRTFPSGDQVANFSIAVSESWRDKDSGEKKERTEWINIVCTGGLAKVASEYLRKGSQVMVSGKFRTRKWTDQQTGQERYATEIRADSMQMLGGRGDGEGSQRPAQRAAPAPPRPAASPTAAGSGFDDMDDDVPFF